MNDPEIDQLQARKDARASARHLKHQATHRGIHPITPEDASLLVQDPAFEEKRGWSDVILCRLCSWQGAKLTIHLYRSHPEITIEEYRARFGYKKGESLISMDFRCQLAGAFQREWDGVVESNRIAKIKATHRDPAHRQLVSEATKLALADPSVKLKISRASLEAWANNPSRRQEYSGIAKTRFADAAFKQKRLEAFNQPETAAKISASNILSWSTAIKRKRATAERSTQRMTTLQRAQNLEGIDRKTGLRLSLSAHLSLDGLKPYEMKNDIYPGSCDPFNAIKPLWRKFQPVIQDEKKRISKLSADLRQKESTLLRNELAIELAKPKKKIG